MIYYLKLKYNIKYEQNIFSIIFLYFINILDNYYILYYNIFLTYYISFYHIILNLKNLNLFQLDYYSMDSILLRINYCQLYYFLIFWYFILINLFFHLSFFINILYYNSFIIPSIQLYLQWEVWVVLMM